MWVVLLFIRFQRWIFSLCNGWCDSRTSGFVQVTPITWHLWRQFKGILLHPRYHRKYESLLPRKPPCDVPCRAQCYICKKKSISEKYEEDVACVRHAGLRKCLSLSFGACMPGSLPSVVLTHSSFDIAYIIDMLKGAVWNLSAASCVSGVVDAAGRPGVVLSGRYVTLCGSIEHRSPKSESRQTIQS